MHLTAILVPVILGIAIAIGIISYLFVRHRRRASAARSRNAPGRNSAPNGEPLVRSWNSFTWPGFETILNRTSSASRKSGNSNVRTVDLERGTSSIIRPCPNPKVMSSYSLPKKSVESEEWDNNKRIRSSMFSIITLPPDA